MPALYINNSVALRRRPRDAEVQFVLCSERRTEPHVQAFGSVQFSVQTRSATTREYGLVISNFS